MLVMRHRISCGQYGAIVAQLMQSRQCFGAVCGLNEKLRQRDG